MIKNKKKIKEIDLIISLFLIVLTILMPITFTALQPEIDLVKGEIKPNPVIDSFASVFSKVIGFFDVVPSVMAQDLGCCEIMKNGAKCQISTEDECQSQWHQGQSCDTICQIGCCIDSQGFCSKQAISTQCLVPPALKFVQNDPNCQQDILCKMGCCTVGYQKIWTTNLTCSNIYHGVWDGNVPDELTCIQQASQEQRGCCRSYAGCEYITGAECSSKSGSFFPNMKCYSGVPGCNCQLNSEGKCVEGFPDLYKADSCGNAYIDEIKEQCSANGGFCNASSNKCQSGTCFDVYDNYNKNNGDFTALPGRHGQLRESGESWCVYDRPDLVWGNGTEPAGSRHWRCYCVNGIETCEPASDYRQEICAETLFDINKGKLEDINYTQRYSSSNYRSVAVFVGNPWRTCILLNDEEKCNANPGCFWITGFAPLIGKNAVDIFRIEDGKEKGWAGVRADSLAEIDSGDPQLGTVVGPPRCLPKIPPGLDVGFFTQFQNKETVCKLGSYSCTVKDRLSGGDENPECDDNEWMELMAHRCRAIADCGVWFNYLHAPSASPPVYTATQDGILIAEVTPEYDSEGNVSAKEIEINYKLLDNNFTKFEEYREIINDPSKTFDMKREKGGEGGWGWALLVDVIGYLVAALFPGESGWGLGLSFEKFRLVGAWWSGEEVGLLNAYTGIAIICFVIAWVIPGPQWAKETFRTLGYGFAAKGIATALGASTPVGWIIGAVALITYALFFAVWDVDHMVVECYPYMPPVGGDDCEKCNDDPMRPCSKYRCESLGTACVWKGTTADGVPCEQSPEQECGICQKENNDGAPPLITKVSVKEEGYSVSPSQPGMPPSTIVISKNGGIDPWSSFTVTLEFNERAVCKWYNKHTLSFSDMPPVWFDSNTWKYSQTMTIPVGQLLQGYNTVQIYLRCADSYMNANIGEYILQFNVSTTDLTPPVVLGTDRDYYNKFSYGVTELPLSIYVNEMAKCRWAKQDVDYSLMGGECSTTLTQTGFKCNTTLTGLQSEPPGIANTFYIRCNDTSGNVMQQSYQLILYPTLPLKIINIIPENGAHVKGCEISGVELEVETAEGAENGKAICYWQNGTQWQRFTVTNDVVHLTNLSAVSQTVNIKCYDSALNVAQNSTSFTVEADQTPPTITRIFKDGSQLVIRTDEDATCAYHYAWGQKINNCNFVANNTMQARKFTTTGGTEHRTEWDDEPWYVKCYDSCGNGINNPCTIVYPSELE
ncbi:MAG: hypothetical protein QXK80_00555 [Candidatus Pacearchaeota archaeon]